MIKPSIKPLSALLASLLLLAACKNTQPGDEPAAPRRIVAVGDLHGDLNATRRALRLAGAIDAQDRWIGKDLILVQTGDQLDRGDEELAILKLLEGLAPQAEAAGGRLHVLNGNHEIMNVELDFRYVTPHGFSSFAGLAGLDLKQPRLAPLPEFARPRAAAFAPGGPLARQFAQRPVILQLDGNLFAHGGVLPEHLSYGIEEVNLAYSKWLKGELAQLPPLLSGDQSPIWSRTWSDTATAPDCARLAQTLTQAEAKRMIVGHTVHGQINSACQDKVWRIDVGMAKAYGGPVQVLEIQGDRLRVLSEGPVKD
ncbi:MAG: calcineurin [Candidatus Melainabacteria bacterium HGW-Melainabacteria-1]|nr:MAG: calcineurin [Candidatus Melainabacteria bacterium HGW-Melainabacteria-1]